MFIHSRKDWTRTRTTKKSRVVGTSCMGTQIVPEHIACVIAVRTYRRSLPDHWSTGTKTLGTSLAYIREYPTGMTCVPAIVECRYPAITFESCWYKNEHNETLTKICSAGLTRILVILLGPCSKLHKCLQQSLICCGRHYDPLWEGMKALLKAALDCLVKKKWMIVTTKIRKRNTKKRQNKKGSQGREASKQNPVRTRLR